MRYARAVLPYDFEVSMEVRLVPKQASPSEETRRQKLEQLAQEWIEILLSGGNYKSCGLMLSTIGTDWLRGRGHDVLVLR